MGFKVLTVYIEIVMFAFFMALILDVNHTFHVKGLLQGAADAASLAGAWQNAPEVTASSENGAPQRTRYVLTSEAEPAALDAWVHNVSHFPFGAGQGVLLNLQRVTDPDGNEGMRVTAEQIVELKLTRDVQDRMFGVRPPGHVRIPFESTSIVKPYYPESGR